VRNTGLQPISYDLKESRVNLKLGFCELGLGFEVWVSDQLKLKLMRIASISVGFGDETKELEV